MSFLSDGSTADPAVWGDWLECVAQAKQNKVDTQLWQVKQKSLIAGQP